MKTMREQPSGQLRDRIALVTGAASGIGRQTALLFAQEGACVAVADLNKAGVEETARTSEAGGGMA
jgi:NAD(P)-dependent dehydrogenase (short-subunit alcohol dehydrogenase family)